jgi:NADH:ubiquinone oxidoreductase subunit 5 (subunit L)/multisubunit Na+/H+ antiporter MnhA subunit
MIINKIGDFFLLVAISIIFVVFKSLDFSVVFSLGFVYKFKYIFGSFSVIDLICLFLLFGVFTKSSQIFFHG